MTDLAKGERSDADILRAEMFFQNTCRHEFAELIDPVAGGFVRCAKCGLEMPCEEDEAW